jgi:hypothetical protein
MKHRVLMITAAALLVSALTACSTVIPSVTDYGPSAYSDTGIGYSETRVEDNRWRVEFSGGPDVDQVDVEFLALRRAAELAHSNEYEWFEVIDRRFVRTGRSDGPVQIGGTVGVFSGSRGRSGSNVGLHINVDRGNERRGTAILEIMAGSGPMPSGVYEVSRFNQAVEITQHTP